MCQSRLLRRLAQRRAYNACVSEGTIRMIATKIISSPIPGAESCIQCLCQRGDDQDDSYKDHQLPYTRGGVICVEQELSQLLHIQGPPYNQMLPFSSGFIGITIMASSRVIAAEKPLQQVAR